jgi:hypothetical protein
MQIESGVTIQRILLFELLRGGSSLKDQWSHTQRHSTRGGFARLAPVANHLCPPAVVAHEVRGVDEVLLIGSRDSERGECHRREGGGRGREVSLVDVSVLGDDHIPKEIPPRGDDVLAGGLLELVELVESIWEMVLGVGLQSTRLELVLSREDDLLQVVLRDRDREREETDRSVRGGGGKQAVGCTWNSCTSPMVHLNQRLM